MTRTLSSLKTKVALIGCGAVAEQLYAPAMQKLAGEIALT